MSHKILWYVKCADPPMPSCFLSVLTYIALKYFFVLIFHLSLSPPLTKTIVDPTGNIGQFNEEQLSETGGALQASESLVRLWLREEVAVMVLTPISRIKGRDKKKSKRVFSYILFGFLPLSTENHILVHIKI